MLTCTFENNNQAHLRHAVVSAICVRDNQILLVKRAPFLINGNKIAIPGGYIDLHETAKEAVIRELFEETGYESKSAVLFLLNDHPHRKNEDRQNVDFIYLVEPGAKTGIPDHESTHIGWYMLNNLPEPADWAFDHYEIVTRYREYLKNPIPLPIQDFNYPDR